MDSLSIGAALPEGPGGTGQRPASLAAVCAFWEQWFADIYCKLTLSVVEAPLREINRDLHQRILKLERHLERQRVKTSDLP